MFNFSKYCGAFHCCTTLASVVGTLTVTIHQKLKSHVITLSPQVVTTSLNSQPLEHRKKHRKEREKEKRHQQPPQTSAEIKTQDMQLSNLNLHRAIEHANTTRLCTGHTHTRALTLAHTVGQSYKLVSQVSTWPPQIHPDWTAANHSVLGRIVQADWSEKGLKYLLFNPKPSKFGAQTHIFVRLISGYWMKD